MFQAGADLSQSRLVTLLSLFFVLCYSNFLLIHILQQFCREALVWRTLRHKYILPLIGVDRETFPSSFCMVSPWMQHGTILKYLKERGRADVPKMVSPSTRLQRWPHVVAAPPNSRGFSVSALNEDCARRLAWGEYPHLGRLDCVPRRLRSDGRRRRPRLYHRRRAYVHGQPCGEPAVVRPRADSPDLLWLRAICADDGERCVRVRVRLS